MLGYMAIKGMKTTILEKESWSVTFLSVDGVEKTLATRIQGFTSIYLQQPIHFATVLINKTYSTITRQIEITNNHYNNQNYECVIAQYNLN